MVSTPDNEPLTWRDVLTNLASTLNVIQSDGPLMDSLDAEGPWWTPPDETGVRLHDAITTASRAVDAELALVSEGAVLVTRESLATELHRRLLRPRHCELGQ